MQDLGREDPAEPAEPAKPAEGAQTTDVKQAWNVVVFFKELLMWSYGK